jgi:voltage-gated potassium channel
MSTQDQVSPELLESAKTLSRKEKVLLVGGAAARTVLGAVIIWVGLSLIPSDPEAVDWAPVLFIIVAVLVFTFFFSFQLKKIKKARYPQIRSIEALIMVSIMFIAVFAAIYTQISIRFPGSFSEPLDHFNAYYYAMTVLATVGFGDITPVTPLARVISMIQMGLDLAFIGVAVRVVSSTAKSTIENRRTATESKRKAQEGVSPSASE